MKEIKADKSLIAFCGLYCGSCKKYLMEKCAGCRGNIKATWCKVRTCCMEKKIDSCADCKEFTNASDCKKFNNFFSKMFKLFLGSDRQACIDQIKTCGYDKFAADMAEKKIMTIKKKD